VQQWSKIDGHVHCCGEISDIAFQFTLITEISSMRIAHESENATTFHLKSVPQ
jgi:hypothetical protein